MKIFFLLTYLLVFLVPSIPKTSHSQNVATLIHLRELPPLEALESAVLDRAGFDPKDIEKWQRGARWSAALPQLQIGWESRFVNQNTTIIQDNLSVTASGITVGPESNRINADLGNNRDFEVRAVWALNDLLFNRDQLYISHEARDLYFVRNKLISDLHDHYYELKSLLLAAKLNPAQSKEPLWNLQVERKVAQLNSITGGEFKRLLSSPSS